MQIFRPGKAYGKRYKKIDNEKYEEVSLTEIYQKINGINSLNLHNDKKTLEAKVKSFKELPKLIIDSGIRYRKYFNEEKLEAWYKEI